MAKLEPIHHKLSLADDDTLHDVLPLLANEDTVLAAWDEAIIANCKAGKCDNLSKQLKQEHTAGKYDVLTDGLELKRQLSDVSSCVP